MLNEIFKTRVLSAFFLVQELRAGRLARLPTTDAAAAPSQLSALMFHIKFFIFQFHFPSWRRGERRHGSGRVKNDYSEASKVFTCLWGIGEA